ncbi:MAG: hypothetical protein ACTJG2_03450 [Candidatus Saccharimonadales bacterium]
MNDMLHRFISVVGIAAAIALVYLLSATTPTQAGAIGVLAVFLLSYIVLAVALTFFIFWLHKIIVRVFYSDKPAKVSEFGLRKAYYYSSILALGPVMMVSLRSVGQDGPVEYGLIAFLLFLGCVYVSRQAS